jgi:hypothetical protein
MPSLFCFFTIFKSVAKIIGNHNDVLFFLQALPIYLEKIFNTVVAVILSVTFVLAFGEVKYNFQIF